MSYGIKTMVVAFICFMLLGFSQIASADEFSAWLQGFRDEASAAGISADLLEEAFADLEPLERVIELDRRQPEFVQPFHEYLERRVTDARVAEGREMMARHAASLNRVAEQYGVQPRFIVALWGLESNYGRHTGSFSVIQSLATLAYEGRRGAFFRNELLHALKIVDAGHIPLARMTGSWAGAMGQAQFMPSTFSNFAVDGDGDGRIDIWHSIPDVFASAANYLSRHGWQDDQTWGRPVRLPRGFDADLAGLDKRARLSQWQQLGVRRLDGRALPTRDLQASLIIPEGVDGPAYLVYDNFRVLLRWNRSNVFAVSVGTLADLLAAP
ncbi:membrane-bound lytic murein transglycosylase B [Geoalkalibacter ferrihydriticus]|uniref:Lytic transglycosylase n=2 Tax=Geoalkalibacter ferrihydriticus TaxID=392333 RepID=A0A0C2HLM3_9BACT|nr:lytic murein transglycosylase [Geoalkalibacter ferrihydriticus]KIH75895.1 lytic transglycosylase [Geoalkalibacter ferrihydriticus DSM 17813]SDM53859.1 membrane-bound lytic murein transglycosylase B [Geoalkalibacter ferrihydriticus]